MSALHRTRKELDAAQSHLDDVTSGRERWDIAELVGAESPRSVFDEANWRLQPQGGALQVGAALKLLHAERQLLDRPVLRSADLAEPFDRRPERNRAVIGQQLSKAAHFLKHGRDQLVSGVTRGRHLLRSFLSGLVAARTVCATCDKNALAGGRVGGTAPSPRPTPTRGGES